MVDEIAAIVEVEVGDGEGAGRPGVVEGGEDVGRGVVADRDGVGLRTAAPARGGRPREHLAGHGGGPGQPSMPVGLAPMIETSLSRASSAVAS